MGNMQSVNKDSGTGDHYIIVYIYREREKDSIYEGMSCKTVDFEHHLYRIKNNIIHCSV